MYLFSDSTIINLLLVLWPSCLIFSVQVHLAIYELKDGDTVIKIKEENEKTGSAREFIFFFPKIEIVIFLFFKQVSGLGNSWQITSRPLDINLSESSSLSQKDNLCIWSVASTGLFLDKPFHFKVLCWFHIFQWQLVLFDGCIFTTFKLYLLSQKYILHLQKTAKREKKPSLIWVHFAYSTQGILSSSSWLLQALWQSRPPNR